MISEPALSPFDLYRAGRYTECLRATEGDDTDETHVVRARVLLQIDRRKEAFEEAGFVRVRSGDLAATAGAIRCRAASSFGDHEWVDRWLRRDSREYSTLSAIGRAEIAIARAVVAMHRGQPDEMEVALETCDLSSVGPWYDAWRRHLLAWSAVLRSDISESLRRLVDLATFLLSSADASDAILLARCVRGLSGILRDSFSNDYFENLVEFVARVPWIDELAEHRFYVMRSLAWAYALHGSERKSHQCMFELLDEPHSAHQRAMLFADQAYFVLATGCDDMAQPLLDRAIEYANGITWTSAGEDRLALLNLAILAAERQGDQALGLLKLYDGIAVPLCKTLALAHDRRLRAYEDHARGAALGAVGNLPDGIRLLKCAFATFSSIGFAWRAASVALWLHKLTSERKWLREAESAVAEFPKSAIAREIRRRASSAEDERLARLTATQRRVFELVCRGLSDAAIAAELGIAINTARNHVAAVRQSFDARSRAQVVAIARDAGLR